MGSYAELYIGRLLAVSSKNDVIPDVVGLFQRDEFKSLDCTSPLLPEVMQSHYQAGSESEDDVENSNVYFYATTLSEIKERLEYLGYTTENVRSAFYAWRDREVAWKREMMVSGSSPDYESYRKELQSDAEELSGILVEDWVEATKNLIECGSRGKLSEAMRRVLDHVGGGYEFDYGPSYDSLISIRIMCEYASPDEIVCYDVTDLVHSDYLHIEDDPGSVLVRFEFDSAADIFRNSKTIVLVEGRSDARLLKAAMIALFPRLADRFVFFDYDEYGMQGGAGSLVNVVKSFVAAEVANRIVAVFDNDTGAEEALRSLKGIKLPRNVKTVKLPDIALLHDYPTVGPSGNARMNISGRASGIELYLGADVLARNDGTMREIRWTGYSAKVAAYQGELVEKSEVQELFLKKIASRSTLELRQDENMRPMVDLLWSIITAFSKELGSDILRYADLH